MEQNIGEIEQFIINRYAVAEISIFREIVGRLSNIDIINNYAKQKIKKSKNFIVWNELIGKNLQESEKQPKWWQK